MKTFAKRLALIAGLTLSLQSCIFVVGAAAGAAAIAVVYDHRTIQSTLDDTNMANRISNKIRAYPYLRNESHIEVTVFNGVILLTGETPQANWRTQVEDIAKSISNNARIYNQITIQGPISSLTSTSDAWVTTKIRSLMLANEDLKSSSIKVVTENGTVYLMGVVKRQQAEIAVDIARQVSGVQRVVKVFQYR